MNNPFNQDNFIGYVITKYLIWIGIWASIAVGLGGIYYVANQFMNVKIVIDQQELQHNPFTELGEQPSYDQYGDSNEK